MSEPAQEYQFELTIGGGKHNFFVRKPTRRTKLMYQQYLIQTASLAALNMSGGFSEILDRAIYLISKDALAHRYDWGESVWVESLYSEQNQNQLLAFTIAQEPENKMNDVDVLLKAFEDNPEKAAEAWNFLNKIVSEDMDKIKSKGPVRFVGKQD